MIVQVSAISNLRKTLVIEKRSKSFEFRYQASFHQALMFLKRTENVYDFTSALTSIFRRVETQLEEYDKIELEIQSFLNGSLPQKIRNRLKKVQADLSISEVNARTISNEVDLLNRWLRSLEEQKKTILKVDNNVIPANITRSFGSNAKILKEMEIELLVFIRQCIDSYETPTQIRLTQNFKMAQKKKADRLKVFQQLSDRSAQLQAKFVEVEAENQALTSECKRVDEILHRFSTSEAFEQLQKAKKQRYIVDDWKTKKMELMDKIESAKIELAAFKEDNSAYSSDKSSKFNLMRKAHEIDDELEKKTSKYNDQIQSLQQDLTAFSTHRQSMMKQLENDLVLAQFQGVSAEKKKTATEVKSMKGTISRSISKYTTNRHQKNRQVEINLRKKGLLLKDSFDVLQASYNDDIQMIKTSFESVLNDLRNIIKMRHDNHSLSADVILNRIENDIELVRATTENAKIRINHRNVERNIELSAVHNRLVTVQGVVDDILREIPVFEKRNAELQDILQNQQKEKDEKFKNLKIDLEANELITHSIQFLVDWFKYSIMTKIDKANDDYLFTEQFKQRALKRSKSQMRLKKLTKLELFEWMKNQHYNKPSSTIQNEIKSTDSQKEIDFNDSNNEIDLDDSQKEEDLHDSENELLVSNSSKIDDSMNNNEIDSIHQYSDVNLNPSEMISETLNDDLIHNLTLDGNFSDKKDNSDTKESKDLEHLNLQQNEQEVHSIENAKELSDKEIDSPTTEIKSNVNSIEDLNSIQEKPLNAFQSAEKSSKSNSEQKPIEILPPPTTSQFKPRRKIIQISTSAASLCPTIAINTYEEEEDRDDQINSIQDNESINQITKNEYKPLKKFDASIFDTKVEERGVKIESHFEEWNVAKPFLKKSSKSEEKLQKVESNSLSYAQESIIKYKSENNLNKIVPDENFINGRLLIDYDKSLTDNKAKRKKLSQSFTYKKKLPNPIPNEEPSFVHKRSPRHVVFAKTPKIELSEIRKASSTNTINVNVVDINRSIVGENQKDESQPITVNVNEDVLNASQTSKKKKKCIVKKNSKISTKDEKKSSKKRIKLANEILNFSLPTTERRKALSQNVIAKNGSFQLKKRVNGSIFAIHPL